MTDGLAAIQQRGVEVRQARKPDFPLINQREHRRPRIFHRNPTLVGPVELEEVDALYAKPPQRVLALRSDSGRPQRALGLHHAIVLVPLQTALREDERPIRWRQRPHETADDFFGVPEPVDAGGINPVHPQIDSVPHRGDRVVVVLRPPTERPAAAPGRPRAESDDGDLDAGLAKRAPRQRVSHGSNLT